VVVAAAALTRALSRCGSDSAGCWLVDVQWSCGGRVKVDGLGLGLGLRPRLSTAE
jgi:hypothetical protein